MWIVFLSAGIVAFRSNFGLSTILEENSRTTATDRIRTKACNWLLSYIAIPWRITARAIQNIGASAIPFLPALEHTAEVSDLSNARHIRVSLAQLIHNIALRDATKTHNAEITRLTNEHAKEYVIPELLPSILAYGMPHAVFITCELKC